MSTELIELLKFAGLAIGGVTLWFKDTIAIRFGIKQGEKNLQAESLNNLQKNLDLYQELLTDMEVRYKHRIEDIQSEFNVSLLALRGELDDLKKLNNNLNIMIDEQEAMIKKQAKRLNYYNNKYGDITI